MSVNNTAARIRGDDDWRIRSSVTGCSAKVKRGPGGADAVYKCGTGTHPVRSTDQVSSPVVHVAAVLCVAHLQRPFAVPPVQGAGHEVAALGDRERAVGVQPATGVGDPG